MSQSTLDIAQLQQALRQSHPALHLDIRGPIDGGLSGADVLFVDYLNRGQQQHGVLKVVSANNASKEREGDEKARDSWFAKYLPTHFEVLDALPGAGKIPLLFSLAKDRSDNCQTLFTTLHESYPYARDHVLFALAWDYRTVAATRWNTSELKSFKDLYLEPLREGLASDWESEWQAAGLPGAAKGTIVFEGLAERWPNPVAFALRDDIWPAHESLRARVPWLTSHGDLNTRNVLCPGIQRAVALEIVRQSPTPNLLLPHLSLIDTPFCRDLPFTYDIAFLTASLRVLSGFDSRAGRDNAIKAFKALLDEVRTGVKPVNVPADSERFVACASKLWHQLRFAQEKMPEDIQAAYLASLASASLWQAIKAHRRARELAVSGLCLSALALRQLLGKHAEHLAGPDHELWTHGQTLPGMAWTSAASNISTLLRQSAGRRVFVLVIGQESSKEFGLPAEEHLPELRKASPVAILEAIEPTPGTANTVGNLGRGPFAAVFDWSAFPYPRRAIANQVPPPALLSVHLRGDAEPDWGARDCIFYFHLRGSLENGTLALTGPERSKVRRELKQSIAQFRKKRTGELTVIYVAVNDAELREANNYLQELWNERLRGVYIGPDSSSLATYLEEWNIPRIDGTLADIAAACADLIAPDNIPTGTATAKHIVTVADMSWDEDGSLIASQGTTLSITVSDADYEAITRAGEFLCQSDLAALKALKRDAKEFFLGHRIDLAEVALSVPIEREAYTGYSKAIAAKLTDKHPQTLVLPSRPGAGASTALRWLAYRFAFNLNVPTLVLTRGGSPAFEAIERLQRVVGRSFLVVADPQDVPSDEVRSLQTRCAPARYPVLFLTSVRSTLTGAQFMLPVLPIELSVKERIEWLQHLGCHCPTVDLAQLMRSSTRSMFFLSLEAFGGSNVRVNPLVKDLLEQASADQAFLLATVAFFSRFTHRDCSDVFLEVLTGESAKGTNEKLEPYDQILVLRERDGWACRHEDLSKAILQFQLARTFTDDYRHSLAEFATSIIGKLSEEEAGADIAAEYVWAMMNPQLEAQRNASGEKVLQSRLLHGDDGVTQDAMRRNIYASAEKSFPSHINIVSHYGKFLSEVEKKYAEAEYFLMRAHELDEHNEAVLHMLGKRFFDELRELMHANPADTRSEAVAERIAGMGTAAHDWFDRARAEARGSEYNYTTAIQLDVELIRDEFRKLGAKTAADRVDALVHESVATLLSHADGLVDEGLRFIEPLKESRQVFNHTRDLLHALRGDLSEAIRCYQRHVRQQQKGVPLLSARLQLARLLRERAEDFWRAGDKRKSRADFEEAQRHLYDVLQDPARKGGNIRLWFDCARYLPQWRRADFLERLHQLEAHDPAGLEPAFLLMCLYFADAAQTGSPESWRKCEEYQSKSAQRSSALAVRRYIREWLVEEPTSNHPEFRVLPHHLYEIPGALIDSPKAEGFKENRVRLQGLVSKIDSSTVGYLTIEPTGFRVFFQPRVKDHDFYASDAGRTRVSFVVAFTYEKPQALDVTRLHPY